MRRAFPILMVLAVAAALGWNDLQRRRLLSTSFEPDPARQVILLSTPWCGYCAAARAFLTRNGVSFEELDVEDSERGSELYRALGATGVPILLVDGEPIRGLDVRAFIAALARDGG